MGKDSSIQWTTHTFNPWRGCTRVSEGCRNCYAEALSRRNPKVLGVWGPQGTRVVASEANWSQVSGWDRAAKKAGERHRVFCASLADVFEDWQCLMVNSVGENLWIEPRDPREAFLVCQNRNGSFLPHECFRPLTMDDVRRRLFRKIAGTPNLDYLLLTKRIENVVPTLARLGLTLPPNAWLGTTIENQKMADERIPHLLRCPAAVRFLSVEPMLERIDLTNINVKTDRIHDDWLDCLRGEVVAKGTGCIVDDEFDGIDWMIVGGESGPHARPFDLAWARSIRDQCKAAGVAFFMKQMGNLVHDLPMIGWPFGPERWWESEGPPWARGPKLKDSHGGDWDEWPADLRVREFPRSGVAHAQA